MSLWSTSRRVGIMPYPGRKYFQSGCVIGLATLATVVTKSSLPGQLWNDPGFMILYTSRGLTETLLAAMQVLAFALNYETLTEVMTRFESSSRKHSVVSALCLSILDICYMTFYFTHMEVTTATVLANFASISDNVYIHLIVFQFNCLLSDVSKEFNYPPLTRWNVLRIAGKRLDLLDTSRAVGNLYSLQNFIICSRTSVNFIYNMFTVVELLITEHYAHMVFRAAAAMLNMIILFVAMIPVVKLQRQADKFNKDLFKLMRQNPELCSDEKLQLYVLMKPNVTFSASGFFTLGYPLVTSIIAAAMTYLVILVQFASPSKS